MSVDEPDLEPPATPADGPVDEFPPAGLDAALDVDLDLDPAGTGLDAEPEIEPEQYTIDELAAVSGVPSRTIRYYQSKGTLPAPERRGRVAFYGPEHAERLRVIAELQDRGLRLDAIRDALQQIEQGGDSLQSWLGVGDRLQAPWSDDRPIVLSEEELLDRLGEVGRRPGILADLQRRGTIVRQGHSRPAMFVVPSPALLDIALELESEGIDVDTAFEAGEIMRAKIARMADDLVKFFAERAGQGFGGAGDPEDIARAFEALRPTGVHAVQLIFAQEMERSLREFVEAGGAMRAARRRDDDRGERPERDRSDRSDRSGHRGPRKPGRR